MSLQAGAGQKETDMAVGSEQREVPADPHFPLASWPPLSLLRGPQTGLPITLRF